MGGENHQIPGDVRSEESSERKKSDDIDRTRGRAKDGWQQPVRCSDLHQLVPQHFLDKPRKQVDLRIDGLFGLTGTGSSPSSPYLRGLAGDSGRVTFRE